MPVFAVWRRCGVCQRVSVENLGPMQLVESSRAKTNRSHKLVSKNAQTLLEYRFPLRRKTLLHCVTDHYETVITINTSRYFHCAYHRKTTNSRYLSRDSWLFVWESAVSALLRSSVLMSLHLTKWSIFSLRPGGLGSGLFRSAARPFAQKLPLKRSRQRFTRTRRNHAPRGLAESWCRDAQWRRKLIASSEITGRIFFS